MENLNNQLVRAIKETFVAVFEIALDDSQIQLQKTRKEFDGDITLVFSHSCALRKNLLNNQVK